MRGLLFLAACALAVDLNFVPLYSFSAKFNSSSATAAYISSYDSISGDCSTGSVYPYVTFNYTFATAGVRFINAVNTYAVHVASGGYNISDLCQNTTGTVWPLDQSRGNSYADDVYQYGHYFEANVSYTIFVFGTSSSATSSPTIAELWDTNFNGQLTVSNTTNNSMWMPVEYSGTTCSQSSTNVFFSTQVISVNTSGLYNIFAVFGQNFHLPANNQKPASRRLAVLRGSLMSTNVTSATCATLGSNFIVDKQDSYSSSESSISILGVQLDANQAYTLVVSATESTDIEAVWQGHYGITVAPTGFAQFSQASTLRPFQRPTRNSCDDTCTRDSSNTTGNPYGIYYFTVPQNSLVYLYAEDTYGDLQWYLYNEHNSVGLTGPSTCGFPLQTCIYDDDYLNGKYVDTGSATELTLIATSYSTSSQFPNANFTLVVVSGPIIGSVPTSRAPTPSSTAPTSQSVNQTNSTTAPTSKGQTIAPTSRRPTSVGETYAPTPKGAAGVNAGSVSQPCMFGLIASLAVLVKLL